VYTEAALKYIEKQRNKIRHKSLEFLKKNCKVPIIVFPKKKVFKYSITNRDIREIGYNEGCVIAKTLRENEDLNKKYNLKLFNMLSVFSSTKNNIKVCLEYLKYFCKADMSKIGIVSITNKNNLGITGIEPYLEYFYEYGIQKQNILIRKDVEEAFKAGNGDGYWKNSNEPNYKGSSFSIHVPLNECGDIRNYSQNKEWLEVAECGIDKSNRFNDIGFGMERIELLFFGIPYPIVFV